MGNILSAEAKQEKNRCRLTYLRGTLGEKFISPFEGGWWKEALAGGHSGLPAHFEEVKEFIQPQGAVLDIGCGPRPAFAPCTVIEPLAKEYRTFVPAEWWKNVTAYAQPAEDFIPGLKADTIIAWNCLQHTIGWRQILDNMLAYGNPGARFAISTDFYPPFIGHPGFGQNEFAGEINKRFAVLKQGKALGFETALLLRARK